MAQKAKVRTTDCNISVHVTASKPPSHSQTRITAARIHVVTLRSAHVSKNADGNSCTDKTCDTGDWVRVLRHELTSLFALLNAS